MVHLWEAEDPKNQNLCWNCPVLYIIISNSVDFCADIHGPWQTIWSIVQPVFRQICYTYGSVFEPNCPTMILFANVWNLHYESVIKPWTAYWSQRQTTGERSSHSPKYLNTQAECVVAVNFWYNISKWFVSVTNLSGSNHLSRPKNVAFYYPWLLTLLYAHHVLSAHLHNLAPSTILSTATCLVSFLSR